MSRAAEPSPLLRRRSLSTHTEAIEVPLADLKRAAHAETVRSMTPIWPGSVGRCGSTTKSWVSQSTSCPWQFRSICVPTLIRPGKPLLGNQPGRPDRCCGPGSANGEDPQADDPAPRRSGHRHDRVGCPGTDVSPGPGAGIHEQFGARIRCPGQQCAGIPRRHLPGGAKVLGSSGLVRCPAWR